MGGRLGQGCNACELASERVRGAKCAKHASSTSPSLSAAYADDGRRGEIGPVPYVLAGGDPARLAELEAKRKARREAKLGMLVGDDGITLAVGVEGGSVRIVGVDGGERWSEVQRG